MMFTLGSLKSCHSSGLGITGLPANFVKVSPSRLNINIIIVMIYVTCIIIINGNNDGDMLMDHAVDDYDIEDDMMMSPPICDSLCLNII